MEKFYINNKNYYKLIDIANMHPMLFKKLNKQQSQSNLLKSIECDESNVFIGIESGNKYVESKSKRSTYFVRSKLIDEKIKIFEETIATFDSKTILTNSPPEIDLFDNERFTDADGNLSNIFTVGKREKDKCYFKFDDIVSFFKFSKTVENDTVLVKRSDILNLIINKSGSYKYTIHYMYFRYKAKKTLFVTFDCLLKLSLNYSNKTSQLFNNWCTSILFTAKFGNDEEKVKLVVTKFGVEPDAVRKILGLSGAPISAIYLYSLGTVKDLQQSLKIPDNYHDDMIVYKYGFTDDICRRSSEHAVDFNELKGSRVCLSLFESVDLEYLSDAETSIENFFKSKKFYYECIDALNKKRTELIIIDKNSTKTKAWADIKKEYIKIGGLYSNTTKANNARYSETTQKLKDALHEVELLQKEVEHLKEKYDTELRFKEEQFNLKLKEEQHNSKLKDEQFRTKEEQHKNEVLALKYELLKAKYNIKDEQ